MRVTLPSKKTLKIKYDDIDSYEPTTDGCHINMVNGKQIHVLNRYIDQSDGLPSIRKLMGIHNKFFYRKYKKKRRIYE
jgi:hypothetical protein